MNIVVLKGNLTRDPEVRDVPLGDKSTTVANFTVAVSRYYKKANGERGQDTEFIDCEAWDTGAVTAGKILSKGDPVLIEGSLKVDTWEDKESGQKRSRTRVRVSNFDKLARFTKQESEKPESQELVEVTNGQDIPF